MKVKFIKDYNHETHDKVKAIEVVKKGTIMELRDGIANHLIRDKDVVKV
jgi:hypothetical protein